MGYYVEEMKAQSFKAGVKPDVKETVQHLTTTLASPVHTEGLPNCCLTSGPSSSPAREDGDSSDVEGSEFKQAVSSVTGIHPSP